MDLAYLSKQYGQAAGPRKPVVQPHRVRRWLLLLPASDNDADEAARGLRGLVELRLLRFSLAGGDPKHRIGRTPADEGGEQGNETKQSPIALRTNEVKAQDCDADDRSDKTIDAANVAGHGISPGWIYLPAIAVCRPSCM